jgi:hypothetical protein|uniref:Uncharacterized protein n=1 Tax=viral metagenome TaxID=1070528 RepID=A0A6C0CZ78_9ZZZZ
MKKLNLYNTGFLSGYDLNEFRVSQGLDPQNIADTCDYVTPKRNITDGKCNNFLLYPVPSVQLNYGLKPIPSSATCARYVQAP